MKEELGAGPKDMAENRKETGKIHLQSEPEAERVRGKSKAP